MVSLSIHTSMDAACLAQAQMIAPARWEKIAEKAIIAPKMHWVDM